MPAADRRAAILTATEQLLEHRRFHELTLEAIAEAAKVGKGTIYRYFEDKDDVFLSLAMHGHDELCETIIAIADSNPDLPFRERLEDMCARIEAFFRSRFSLLRVIGEHEGRLGALEGKRRQQFNQHRTRMRSVVSRVLAIGVTEGLVRTDIPLETLTGMLMGGIMARIRGYERDDPIRPTITQIVEIFLNGAGPPQP